VEHIVEATLCGIQNPKLVDVWDGYALAQVVQDRGCPLVK
jgi:hypothetical protein